MQALEETKTKGLIPIEGSDEIVRMALLKLSHWGGIWKSIKTLDKDSNGYLTREELDEVFREWFPIELEGKTLLSWFRRYGSIQNRNLINYKQIKQEINEKIMSEER